MRDAERYADKASAKLDDAEQAARELEPKKMESALEDAKEWLAEKDAELHPETQMHIDRYKELVAKLPAVKAEREKRDLELRLNKARDKIVPRVQAMLEAQENLAPAAPTLAQVEAVESKAKDVREAVDDEADLFAKDQDFAAWAKSQRNKVDKALEAAGRARKAISFLEGPVVAWKDALALQEKARGTKNLADKEAWLKDARTKLATCERTAKAAEDEKATAGVAFSMPTGKPQTPGQLMSACQKALKDGEAEFKKVSAAREAELAKEKKDAAAAEAKRKKEEAAAEAKRKKEQAAAEAKRKKEEAAAEAKRKKEEAAAESKRKKEQAAADAKRKKEEAAAAAKKKKEEAAAAAQKKKDEAAAKKKAAAAKK